MDLKKIDADFSVCKIKSLEHVNMEDTYWFLSKTDEELSLVCQTQYVPSNHLECERGWRAFKVMGVLDFSLVGILSKITTILADNAISIFAVSTYNTDYILVKEENHKKACNVLNDAGYSII